MKFQAFVDVLNELQELAIDRNGGEDAYILVENNCVVREKLAAVGVTEQEIKNVGDDDSFCLLALAFSKYSDQLKYDGKFMMRKSEELYEYYLAFKFNYGSFNLDVSINYSIIVPSLSEGRKKAKEMGEELGKLFTIKFDVQADDFIIRVKENDYFDQVFIDEYSICDLAAEELEDGECPKQEFVERLKTVYKEYLKNYGRLTFKSNTYGVRLIWCRV